MAYMKSILIFVCVDKNEGMDMGKIEKEGNALFNDVLNTFYLRLCGVRHMVEDNSDRKREEIHCGHMGYSFRLTAKVLLYAPSHRQDNTYTINNKRSFICTIPQTG